jgi:L-iditol 2-dehydrogenase
MLQAILHGPRQIEYREVAVPEPGEGQVLVAVKRIGICGSDIHVYHGKHQYAIFPLVQGHEGSGVVVKTGPGVSGFSPGELVTFRPQQFCGKCLLCRQGRYNLCEQYKVIGVLGGTTGMASEYFLTEAAKLHKLPPGMSADQGAMVEPTAVAVHSVRLAGAVEGGKVLVIGAGPIGNLAAQAAKALGAAETMIVDINPLRLELAARCGVDHCVNTAEIELEAAVLEKLGNERADAILECAGSARTLGQAIRAARRGTNIVLVGNYYGDVPVELGLVQRREINLIGDMNYTAPDYEDAIRLIAAGGIKTRELVSDYFTLTDYEKAYQFIDEHQSTVMKVLLKVAE